MKKKKVSKIILMVIVLILLTLISMVMINYKKDITASRIKLNNYGSQIITTSFGKMSFVDIGKGETVLLSHGIFGGYDQGIESLNSILGDNYRKIVPSRFGYPGSEMISQATPQNQAKSFLELIDQLGIKKVFIVTTSAGGSTGIKFVIENPDRVKGLILLSSAVPDVKKTRKEVKGPTGPPSFLVNDFPMWFIIKYFRSVLDSMMGISDRTGTENIFSTMLPVADRKAGIANDSKVTNLDMDINYDSYPVENINVPILMIHAKDDPMVKFDSIQNFLKRVSPQTEIFDTGGHLITGHGIEIQKAIIDFIEKNK